MWGTNKNIVGFRGYICYNCLSYWAQSNKGDMKSLIQVKPNHKCDPNKVAHALNVSQYREQNTLPFFRSHTLLSTSVLVFVY